MGIDPELEVLQKKAQLACYSLCQVSFNHKVPPAYSYCWTDLKAYACESHFLLHWGCFMHVRDGKIKVVEDVCQSIVGRQHIS